MKLDSENPRDYLHGCLPHTLVATMHAQALRTPTLGLTVLSLCLSIAIIGTAGRSLHVYYSEHSTNLWLLPVWPDHFDLRELQMLVGCAAAIVACNAVLGVSLVVAAVSPGPPYSQYARKAHSGMLTFR